MKNHLTSLFKSTGFYVFVGLFFLLNSSQLKAQSVVDSLLQAKSEQDGVALAATLNELSWEFKSIQMDSAKIFANQAVSLSKELDNDTLLGASYNSMANVFEASGMLDSALVYHQKSLAIKTRLQDSIGIADSYNNLGIVSDELGNYEESLRYYFDALGIYERNASDWSKVPMVLSNIGIVYKKQEAYDKVMDFYTRALSIYQENYHEVGMAITKGNIGALAIKTGAFNKTIQFSEEASELYAKLGYDRYVPYMSVNMAIANDSLNNYREASRLYTEAIAGFVRDDNRYELCNARISFGNSLFVQYKDEQAFKELLAGLQIAEQNNFKEFEQKAAENLAVMYRQGKDFDKAYEYSQRSHTLYKELFEEEKTKSIFELETKYQTQKKENQILVQQAQLTQKEAQVVRKNIMIYGSLGLAVILGLLGFLFFRQQKLKNEQLQKEAALSSALAKIETQNKLQEQRLRISRDLHDNIGAQLTFIISSLDNLKFGYKNLEKGVTDKLGQVSTFTGQTIYELRDTIWAMNKSEIGFDDLKSRISNFIEKAASATQGVRFSFDIDSQTDSQRVFTSVQGMNIYRIIQECINNSLKYANASKIAVTISENATHIVFNIDDNGNGFDQDEIAMGNGLNNMKKRAIDLNGDLQVISSPENGTSVRLQMPID
ncbi:MAG: sensor histidine kinase [Gilvibacter sp.]